MLFWIIYCVVQVIITFNSQLSILNFQLSTKETLNFQLSIFNLFHCLHSISLCL